MEKSVRFCVSLHEGLLEELDKRVIRRGYASRSELVRDLIRDLLSQEKWEENQEVIGVLSIIYDHHDKELVYRLLDLQHKHHVNVLCSTHLHLDHHNCLEVIVLRGMAEELESLANQIGGLRGVKLSKLSRVYLPEL
ncbi:nickel-responsive transcriptional regulator NikR [Hydrogenobacter sp. T-2]|uniref:nickel-responsive transcriptional regulator NikR n=1 Tax=Pampinifervens diazotrophicum TaxID=1632018 RepID=UPI002B2604EA|nr:nickel-responsive transcriptional regulator NikR [Hydrogenobacter sp. T-2]WPM31289.1 nickel-responsive transcriptional regulator NikR [Hydrogenobacter sp. T-2]